MSTPAAAADYQPSRRELTSILAPTEKRVLVWLAHRTPAAVNSDHLTLLGLLAMLAGGVFYALSALDPRWLHAVNLALLANWLGDSLDGTLARVRNRQRPRYGFYVDHVVDLFGAAFLLGGLALSSWMDSRIALGLLAAYFALNVNIYLTTHVLGVFKISFGPVGGTELRILLAAANLLLLWAPPSLAVGAWTLGLFDVVGLVGIAGLAVVLTASAARNSAKLYGMERLEP